MAARRRRTTDEVARRRGRRRLLSTYLYADPDRVLQWCIATSAQVISYGPADLQENTGETPAGTGRVLAQMLDGFVMRTADSTSELRTYGQQNTMAPVNAMTAEKHPTQALGDMSTIL